MSHPAFVRFIWSFGLKTWPDLVFNRVAFGSAPPTAVDLLIDCRYLIIQVELIKLANWINKTKCMFD